MLHHPAQIDGAFVFGSLFYMPDRVTVFTSISYSLFFGSFDFVELVTLSRSSVLLEEQKK